MHSKADLWKGWKRMAESQLPLAWEVEMRMMKKEILQLQM